MELFTLNLLFFLKSVLIGLFLIALYNAICFYRYVKRMERAFSGVKIPETHWLLGCFPYFPKDPTKRIHHFIDLCNKNVCEDGFAFLWGFFRRPIVIACSPEAMGQICKSNAPKARGLVGVYRLIEPWLGEGLLVANGKRWARNRRLLTPAFHFDILKPYTKVFNRSADVLVAKLSKKAETKESFEVFQNVLLCTLEIILKCAFSYEKDVQHAGETDPYVKAVNRITDTLIVRLLRPILLWDFAFYLTDTGRKFKKDCDFVHSVAEEIIDKRKQALAAGADADVAEKRYVDFLDILLTARDETGNGLTRLEIRNEVDTFLFEGHDTTGSAISWILYSLAQHPKYQRRCQQEVDALLAGRDTDDIEWSDLSKLEFLTQCIKEGMRLHAPVPILSRELRQELKIGGRVIPPGCLVQLNIWALHHMEKYWGADHWEFKPERFVPENIDKIASYQFVPFSAGNRNCIGQHFAMNEEKVILSKLLRNFTFSLDPAHEVKKSASAVMRTVDGLHMYSEKRSH
ncbi:ultra-long-chain fatty acid omega-hydroxylase-like isoform X4 [Dreissena polymorpha]|uniref:ultra-long-chain fatty acid omega-hydroxylase-like isoform X4 n=1 Tax=Dreissena polymorpha TaxID=45954 RepID=UPI002264ECD5|nr:ultra-long-chain fatty acid omega-hydroxylase-like isoform X4 [Dreissena polymorpha]